MKIIIDFAHVYMWVLFSAAMIVSAFSVSVPTSTCCVSKKTLHSTPTTYYAPNNTLDGVQKAGK